MTITQLTRDRLESFFQYLDKHVAENGANGNALFLPLTLEQSRLSDEMKSKFAVGLDKAYGESGWRRTWIAIDDEDCIMGHADIRVNGQLNAEHRVVLGMGVDSNYRRQKVGFNLMLQLIDYCKLNPEISWLDLDVMANNTKAINLYNRTGFKQVGLTKDMFRIDNTSYDYMSMTLKVES
jgi:ribosomal protein S18 acetylase RimI-like enzyme